MCLLSIIPLQVSLKFVPYLPTQMFQTLKR
nr:unnamed protein product [Callosobruchus chinensis]